MKLYLLPVPDERPSQGTRQRHIGHQAVRPSALVVDPDLSLRVGECYLKVLETAEVGLDGDLGKAGGGGLNSGDRGQQVEIRVRAPRVAVGSRGLGSFGPRGQTQLQHVEPRAELIQVLIAEPGLLHGARKV